MAIGAARMEEDAARLQEEGARLLGAIRGGRLLLLRRAGGQEEECCEHSKHGLFISFWRPPRL
jgi:hypothetical protein